MYEVALVNMPFASPHGPSIALAQLREVVKRAHGDRVTVQIVHANIEFTRYLSVGAYLILSAYEHHASGLGDWIFRQLAFPEQPDNAEEYFQRYYPQHESGNRQLARWILAKRRGFQTFFNELIERYQLHRVDLVGFTSMFSQNVAALAMARLIKERNPECVIAMGGANCEMPMGKAIIDNVSAIDFVFSGPALVSFPELIGRILNGDTEGCHAIDGVLSRRNAVEPLRCGNSRALVSLAHPKQVRGIGEELNINEYIEPDYTDFLDRYGATIPARWSKPRLFIETSRGCWWGERSHCTFCGLNGSTMKYRSLRPELARRLYRSAFKHADRCSRIDAVDNIMPKEYTEDVLPYLGTPPSVRVFYEVKANLTEEDFRALRKARVLNVQPGIEALNTATLKLMRKGVSAFQNIDFLLNALRYGITPSWNLLVGFPGEPVTVYEKYLRDLPLLTHLPPPTVVVPVRFDRYSPYFYEAEAYGLELQPLSWYGMTYPFPRDSLEDLAYYFEDQNQAAPYKTNTTRMIGKLRTLVDRWIELWNQGQRPRLELGNRGGATWVYDSRSGTTEEYALSSADRDLLTALDRPKRITSLLKEFPDLAAESELNRLKARGLLFEEGGRFISLLERGPASVEMSQGDAIARNRSIPEPVTSRPR